MHRNLIKYRYNYKNITHCDVEQRKQSMDQNRVSSFDRLSRKILRSFQWCNFQISDALEILRKIRIYHNYTFVHGCNENNNLQLKPRTHAKQMLLHHMRIIRFENNLRLQCQLNKFVIFIQMFIIRFKYKTRVLKACTYYEKGTSVLFYVCTLV